MRIGQTVHCRILKIDVERFSVDCSSKTSDLLDKNSEWRQVVIFFNVALIILFKIVLLQITNILYNNGNKELKEMKGTSEKVILFCNMFI